jgi:apolipoprotein N-acyltransferase
MAVLVSLGAIAVAQRGILPPPVIYAYVALYGLAGSLPYLADRLLTPRLVGLPRTLVFPLTLVSLEFLLSRTPLGTFGALAYSQYSNLPLVQVVSLTGIWGLSFLVAWFAAVANEVWEHGLAWSVIARSVGLYGGVLLSVLAFGSARLAFFPPEAPTARVAGLTPDRALSDAVENHPSLDVAPGTDATRAAARADLAPILDDLLARSRQEARAGARLVVWSEAAALALEEDAAAVIGRARALAQEEGIHLQLGLLVFRRADQPPFVENRAVLIDPQGEVVWDYHKSVPVPGGEASRLAAGPGVVPTETTPIGRLATVICYDADFPELVRQAGVAGAALLLVPASDWQEVKATHTQMATFRAVENGVTLVRPTRQGISLAVDPQGRVLAAADYYAADQTAIVAAVPTRGVATLYARIGDSFAYLCILGLVVLAGAALFRRRALATMHRVPAPSPA